MNESDQAVFIGFNAEGREVFGTEQDLHEHLQRCEEDEALYGGDVVDYDQPIDLPNAKPQSAADVLMDFNLEQDKEK